MSAESFKNHISPEFIVNSDTSSFSTKFFPVKDYSLDLTFDSGQTFRWEKIDGGWEGVIYNRWTRLDQRKNGVLATVFGKVKEWGWLEDYLQVKVDIGAITRTFPDDPYLKAAVKECRGLRIVRQEPWECLASFLMSSSKQIVQIKQIIANLCRRFGEPILMPPGRAQLFSFPAVEAIARADEAALRECKMGFRAAYLKNTAQLILKKKINLYELSNLPLHQARAALLEFPGVGVKIANCVLLFSLGFYNAFPVDVWVRKALQTFYFNNTPIKKSQMEKFTCDYFGEYGGYAQQYLFHYIRVKLSNKESL
ncbi:MAG: DNA-3-methyladenine glycosylase family protein [Verrucomicrobiia bacterium]